jgi:hypothetical protein
VAAISAFVRRRPPSADLDLPLGEAGRVRPGGGRRAAGHLGHPDVAQGADAPARRPGGHPARRASVGPRAWVRPRPSRRAPAPARTACRARRNRGPPPVPAQPVGVLRRAARERLHRLTEAAPPAQPSRAQPLGARDGGPRGQHCRRVGGVGGVVGQPGQPGPAPPGRRRRRGARAAATARAVRSGSPRSPPWRRPGAARPRRPPTPPGPPAPGARTPRGGRGRSRGRAPARDEERVALHEPVQRGRGGRGAAGQPGDGRPGQPRRGEPVHRGAAQRPEHTLQRRVHLAVAVGRDHHGRQVRHPASEVPQHVEGGVVGPVDVLEDQHGRARCPPAPRAARRARRRGRRRPAPRTADHPRRAPHRGRGCVA